MTINQLNKLPEETYKSIVGYSLGVRGSSDTAKRELMKGLNRHTEQYAFARILPLCSTPRDEKFALRFAGIMGKYLVPHEPDVTFGAWARKTQTNGIEGRLLRLVNLQFDQAIEELDRIFSLLSKYSGGFNWYDLAATLYYWGRGVSDNSLNARQKILRDFYRSSSTQTKIEEDKNE